jgi:hypothetical protein
MTNLFKDINIDVYSISDGSTSIFGDEVSGFWGIIKEMRYQAGEICNINHSLFIS